jgi:hypothetical protein
MNYKKLIKKHEIFKEKENRYWCYDVYMQNKSECWLNSANIPEIEIMKLFWFIYSWDRNFRGNLRKFQKCYKEIYHDIKRLEHERLDQIDLNNENMQNCIENIFNKIASSGEENRVKCTDTSKIIHTILPELFVMWDTKIRHGIWKKQKKEGWKKPKNDKFTGTEYAYCFFPLMQKEANDIIESYVKEHHCGCNKALDGIKRKGSNYTLAKLLDEYNYVKYTLKKDH